ncbi:NUDIX domain-containing protein [Kribbella sp. NPDC058693]|uniref:NUDIX domain-containing protein n=1 Tax=Kribbella sp. NPDC058693 TaxID=3346602 RepID=UPI003662B0D8
MLRDTASRILLVDPDYKSAWDLPGGMIEANEPPLDGLLRKLNEELSLQMRPSPPSLFAHQASRDCPERSASCSAIRPRAVPWVLPASASGVPWPSPIAIDHA